MFSYIWQQTSKSFIMFWDKQLLTKHFCFFLISASYKHPISDSGTKIRANKHCTMFPYNCKIRNLFEKEVVEVGNFFANFLYLISLSQNGISSLSLISLVPLVPKKGGRKHLIPDSRLRANTLCIVLPSKWKMNKILATKKPKGLFSHNSDSECKWHIGQ